MSQDASHTTQLEQGVIQGISAIEILRCGRETTALTYAMARGKEQDKIQK